MIFSRFRTVHKEDIPNRWDYIELIILLGMIFFSVGFILFLKYRYSLLFLHFI
jgi:hypothetical protein